MGVLPPRILPQTPGVRTVAKSAALFAVSSLKMPGTRVMTMVTMAAAMMRPKMILVALLSC